MADELRLKHKSRGQAIVGAFALIIILTVALIYLFNIGTAYSEKIKLADAADAAVYAQATSTAKRLNFAAYTNRAMAINHLAVGHVVSYLSWIRYLDAAWSVNPNYFNQFTPGFGCNLANNNLPWCVAHPSNFLTFGAIRILQPGFTNNFANHQAAVVNALGNLALDNPLIFAGQADAFVRAIAVNRVVTHDVVNTYVQNAGNPIFVNGCALNDTRCLNRNGHVQGAINLATSLGQNNLALMLNSLLPAPAPDPFAGNVTINEQSILAFTAGGAIAAAAIRGFSAVTYANSPSQPWINNRTWQTPQPPNPCNNPVGNITGCRFKTGGTLQVGNDWVATDSATNFNTGVTATGNASTIADIPVYNPFPGGFSLPDAQNGNNGPQTSQILLHVLLSQQLPFTDWNQGEVNKGRRKLALHVIDENNPLQESNVFSNAREVLTAYSQARVFYNRPLRNNGNPQWFAPFVVATEFANLYNPFWQARLVDTVQVDFQ